MYINGDTIIYSKVCFEYAEPFIGTDAWNTAILHDDPIDCLKLFFWISINLKLRVPHI